MNNNKEQTYFSILDGKEEFGFLIGFFKQFRVI